MTTFLEYVAQDIISKHGTDLSRVAVVFPNKRASLFMDEYLERAVGRPIWSPAYMTISDLFRQHSDLKVGDDIKLICDLHKTFVSTTGINETLDHFYGWGQLLLADFDDIDKNLADAKKVYANLRDIHEFDDISYLSDEQKETLKQFFSSFDDNQNSKLREKFLKLWQNFYKIYTDYNKRLESQGIIYEGALYRKVAAEKDIEFEYDKYIFVGFNLLQKVEQQLFATLQHQGKGFFYWDADAYYLGNRHNEAGKFISQYLQAFPNELDINNEAIYDNFNKPKDITYISAPTENAQARYVSNWLREGDRIKAGRKTVIVLCNEGLLQTVIHQLPPEVDKANITTGYPLAGTPVASFVTVLFELQMFGKAHGTDKYRLHYVNPVLRHPMAKYVSDKSRELAAHLNEKKRYYPAKTELALDDNLALLFRQISVTSPTATLDMVNWMKQLLKIIGVNAGTESDPLFQESLFRTYTLLNRLSGLMESGDLTIDVTTLQRLVGQLVQTTSIPFHGEPAEGIQIMGVLETRNLDFEHVLMLSTNDGNMPKAVNDSSFIPYSIRKAYGLTTIDNKVAVFAYYFHRLLQRAGNVTLSYNSSTADGMPQEMSRFMLQMLVESNHDIKRHSLLTGQTINQISRKEVIKTDEIMAKLDTFDKIYPTQLNLYLRCPLRFYYNYILGIEEPDEEDEDELDARIFGDIFHESAEMIYKPFVGKTVTKADIEAFLKDPHKLDDIVDDAFRVHLFKMEKNEIRPEYNGLQIINRSVILRYLKKLLRIDMNLAPFRMKGVEIEVGRTLSFPTSRGEITKKFGGKIDRLDEIEDNTDGLRIRVVDYKTGSKKNANAKGIDDIFSQDRFIDIHGDYYLQTLLYSMIIRHDAYYNPEQLAVSPALLFIQNAKTEDDDPTLIFSESRKKRKIIDVEDYYVEYRQKLIELLSEIYEPQTPFTPTADKQRCAYCPWAKICRA